MFLAMLISAFAGAVFATAAPAAMPLPQVWTGKLEVPPDNQKVGTLRDIEVKIWALSSDQEIQSLAAELLRGGQSGLRQAIFRLQAKAWVRIGNAAATSVGVVRVVDLADGGRRMRLVSAFPARILDSSDPVGTSAHPFAFVELIVDRDGKAEGHMIGAASIAFAAGGMIRMESAGAPAVRINKVATDSPPAAAPAP